MPAEAIYEVQEGDDAGWPDIYYDQFQNKKFKRLSMVGMEKSRGRKGY